MKRYFLQLAFASLALCSLSVPVFADDKGSRNDDGIHMNKNSTYDYEQHKGEITLESFVEGTVKTISKATPADIVMILDCTNSMGSNFNPMLSAAVSFIDSISNDAVKKNINHRIAIVEMRAPEILWCDFTSAITGKTDLENIVNKSLKCDGGTTRHDRAFQWARTLFTKQFDSSMLYGSNLSSTYYQYKGTNTKPTLVGPQADAAKFIVFFTDGLPSTQNQTAQTTLSISRELKMTHDVTIFSIGLLSSLVTTEYSNRSIEGITAEKYSELKYGRTFLNSISSNYPDAESSFVPSTAGKHVYRDVEIHDYFLEVSQTETLAKVFSKVSHEISEAVPSVILGEEVTLKDFINNAFFKLPDGTTPEQIKTVLANCIGSHINSEGKECFDFDTVNVTPIALDVKIDKKVDEHGEYRDYVTVGGFNFSENFCARNTDGSYRGKEVRITIPFVFIGSEESGNKETNTEDSGIYNPPVPVVDPETGEQVKDPETGEPIYEEPKIDPYPVPSISFCTLTIIRQGLERGESAIFIVHDNKLDKDVCKVALSGTEGSSTASGSVVGLPAGTYTVTETNWNWAYEKDPNAIQSDDGNGFYKIVHVSNPEHPNLVNFFGNHKIETEPETDSVKHPAEMHNHDESFVNNVMILPAL